MEKRKVSLSIKLLEELQNKEAVSKFSSPLSGKNLPFSSLSEKLGDKKKDDDIEEFINDFNLNTKVFNKVTFKNFVNEFFRIYFG